MNPEQQQPASSETSQPQELALAAHLEHLSLPIDRDIQLEQSASHPPPPAITGAALLPLLQFISTLEQLQTNISAPPSEMFAAFYSTQVQKMTAVVNSADTVHACLSMAHAVRNDVLSLEAQWAAWFAPPAGPMAPIIVILPTTKQLRNLQLRAHVLVLMVRKIATRMRLLVSAEPGVAITGGQSTSASQPGTQD